MRTAGELQRYRPGKPQERFAALGWASEETRIPGPVLAYSGELQAWALSFWRRTAQGETGWVRATGACADSFWSFLYKRSTEQGEIWLWTCNLYHVLTLLGGWDRILRGELTLAGEGPYVKMNGSQAPAYRGYCCMSDPPSMLVIRAVGAAASFRFVDVRNFGLADWSDLEGDYAETIWHSLEEKPLGRTWDEHARARREAVAAWAMGWTDLVRKECLGKLEMTPGSQSLTAWRSAWMPPGIYLHCDQAALDLEREAYYGGRCEARRLGLVYQEEGLLSSGVIDQRTDLGLRLDGPVYQFDLSAAYPAAAACLGLPCRLLAYAGDESAATGLLGEPCEFRIADVSIDTPQAAFPWRRPEDGLIVYPTGRFRTVLCDPELTWAEELNCINQVHRAAAYNVQPMAAAYMGHLWALRQRLVKEGQAAMAALVKRIMVAWIGKLTQRQRTWKETKDVILPFAFGQCWGKHPSGEGVCQWRSMGGVTSYLEDEGECGHSMPAVAAAVTSYVRFRLWKMIQHIGPEHVYYYDTDSLWTNRVGAERMQSHPDFMEGMLGGWRLVGTYRKVHFYGIKHYVADGVLKCAGLSIRAQVESDTRAFAVEPRGLNAALWARTLPVPVSVKRPIQFARDYKHGLVSPDGSVIPFRLAAESPGEQHGQDQQIQPLGGQSAQAGS